MEPSSILLVGGTEQLHRDISELLAGTGEAWTCERSQTATETRAALRVRRFEIVICDVAEVDREHVLELSSQLGDTPLILLVESFENAAHLALDAGHRMCLRGAGLLHLAPAVRGAILESQRSKRQRRSGDVAIEQRGILERIAKGASLTELLERIVALVEDQADSMLCSILLTDSEQSRLYHAATLKLPKAFVKAIDGAPIGPQKGSCGTAAYRREPVIVEDIESDELWQDYRKAALPYGLKACWSTPILSPTRELLGTFATYYKEPRGPRPEERRWVDVATNLAAIAIHKDHSEKELRDSEAKFRAVFENAPIGMALVDSHGGVAASNSAMQRMLGYSAEELSQRTFVELTHPDDLDADLRLFGEVLSGVRDSYQLEKRYISKGGAFFWARLSASLLNRPVASGLIGLAMLEDIAERKRAEEKLLEQAALLDKAKDAILLRDLDGTVRYFSKGAERLYGFSSAEVVGHKVTELFHPDRPSFDGAQKQLLETGEWAGQLTQSARDQREIVVDASWTLLRDERGQPRSVLAIDTDITQRRKLEEQVMRAQRIDSLGTLAGGIAHDFNNILTAVSGNVKFALNELPDSHPVREAMVEIEEASARAADLVRRILTFSQRHEPKQRLVRFGVIVAEALKLLRASLPARVTIRAELQEDIFHVMADPTELHQVMMNLGMNAAQAMEERGGVLDVRTEVVSLDSALEALSLDLAVGRYVRLRVADLGCGMNRATLDRIFDPFFSTKGPGRGTGLGLSMVHGIVKAHDGGISVQSQPGHGTVFQVYLPAVSAVPSEHPKAHDALPRGSGERVLCVDDEQAVVRVTTRMLTRLGYHVTAFFDPWEALRTFQADPAVFDAVVTDLSMPGISGIELSRELLRLRNDIPILMVSGHLSAQDAEAARAVGVRELLQKPNFVSELAYALRRAFDGLS